MKKKIIKLKVNDFRLIVKTPYNDFIFNMILESPFFFKTLLNHFTKNDYEVEVSLKDLLYLKRAKWL